MWLIYALLAGVFLTGQVLLTRYVLRDGKDAWAFSVYFSLVGAIISLPFMLARPTVPTTWQPWLVAGLVGLLIVGHNWLNFKSAHYLEASLSGAIAKFRLVWVFILGVVALGAPFSWLKLIGTLATVAAGLVIVHNFRRARSVNGMALALTATVVYAVNITLYENLFHDFNAVSLTFFVVFLLPLIFNLILMPQAAQRLRRMAKDHKASLLLACGFGAFANLAMIQGLALGEATSVLVIIEAFLILTLVGEHLILKEKDHFWIKLVAVALATAGAVLIRLSS